MVRNYHGFYLVKGKSEGDVLHYGSEAHDCSVVVDCGRGEVTVRLREEHRGRSAVTKQSADYNIIHEILNDPRLAFMEEVVKPKRRKSQDKNDDEPLTFSISAFKDPIKKSSAAPKLGSFRPSLDFGGGLDLGSDLGCSGPPLPKMGPSHQLTRVEKLQLAETEKLKTKIISNKNLGASSPSPSKQTPVHQDLLAMDYLYKTKTRSELNFLKRHLDH